MPTRVAALFAISLIVSGCERAAPRPPAGLFVSRQARERGGVLFSKHCAICHGANGDGRGRRQEGMHSPPVNLTLPPWSEKANASRTFLAIRNGVRGTTMPAWSVLSDEQIWSLVAYLTAKKGPG
jgi:mono/diheme cytochrome c family protein